MTKEELIEQLCKDINLAHDQIMILQGEKEVSWHDWPEHSSPANSIREAEKMLGKKLAKTNAWTMYPG